MASAEIHLPLSSTTDPEVYTWSFPGSPVRIHLLLPAVEALQHLLAQEVGGGLLLGRAWSPFSIEITGVKTLPNRNWGQLEQAKTEASLAGEGCRVLGYFRTHCGGELSLEAEDIARMEEHFSQPTDVCLLIKDVESATPTAGFFFWDHGRLESRFSFNDFPLDLERLRLEAIEQHLHASCPLQIEIEEVAGVTTRPRRFRVTHVTMVWLAACAFLVAVGLSYTIRRTFLRPVPAASTVQAPAVAPVTSSLALRVETQGGDLRLTWNPESPRLQAAGVTAVLIIVDGSSTRELALDAEALRTVGSVLYTPVSKKVLFRMQLAGAAPGTESVLALKGGPAAEESKPPARLSSASLVSPTPVAGTAVSLTPEPVVPAAARKPEPGRPFVPPASPTQVKENWTQIALDSSPSVPTEASVPATFTAVPLINMPGMPPPAPTPVVEAPGPAAVTPSPVRPETPRATYSYLEPVPVRKVPPIVSLPIRRTLEKGGEVKVKVQIDTLGRVKRADLVSSTSPFLVGAAVSAARLWRFEPAKRNGQTVEGETVIVFTIPPYHDTLGPVAR